MLSFAGSVHTGVESGRLFLFGFCQNLQTNECAGFHTFFVYGNIDKTIKVMKRFFLPCRRGIRWFSNRALALSLMTFKELDNE